MSNQPENQPQPSVAKLALADSPLRDELHGEETYGAPQLDVDVRLNTSENPYPPPDDLTAGLVAQVEKVASDLNRYPDRDVVALRSALADYVTRQTGMGITVGQVWATNGSNEIPQQLLRAFGEPGRSATGFVPSYSMHPILSSGMQTEFIGIDHDPETPDIDMDNALAAVAEHRPDVIFITTPNNPTGNLTTLADLCRIIETAPGVVIADEAYAEFTKEPSTTTLLAEFPSKPVVSRTISKALDFTGGRLGYFVANPAFIDAAMLVHLPHHLSTLTQAAATVVLRHSDVTLSTVARLADERDHVVAALNSYGYGVIDSYSNSVFFGRFTDAATAWQNFLDEGVLIRDIGVPGRLRATTGLPRENDALLAAAKKLTATALA